MVTLQTDGPLNALCAENSARSLRWFQILSEGGESELDIDQPYQRGHVWSDDRRRLLIKSLMLGIPIGAIVVNDRFSAQFYETEYGPYQSPVPGPGRNWAFAIIDGKQRFTTFVMWLRSELAVPASWFPASEVVTAEDTRDGPYVRLSGLVDRQRRIFQNKPVSVVSARVCTLADEKEVFNLINHGGVAQGESD